MERIDSLNKKKIVIENYRRLLSENGVDVSDMNRQIIANEISECFEKGLPLRFIHSNEHLGDHLILRSAISIPLLKFLKKNGYADKQANPYESSELLLKHLSLSHNKNENGLRIKSLFPIWGYADQLYLSVINNFYHGTMLWIADHLGVELTDEDLMTPPIPLKCDFELSPMKNFDYGAIKKYVEYFKSILDMNKTYCIILHGGRLVVKRFSRDQTRSIQKILKRHFPKAGYIILTAQDIDTNGDRRLEGIDADLVVNAVEDINQTIALFLAVDNQTYVATDTFLAWLGSGVIALREDRDGILRERDVYILNTIASADFWRVPRANHLESLVIESMKKSGRLQTSTDHILYPEEYYAHEEYKSYTEDIPEYIAMEDIERFLMYIFISNGITFGSVSSES